MDGKTTTAYNALQSMMFDGTKKPMPLPLSLLEAITNNFSKERILGRGGFAVVYKGILGDEQVAVKKLSNTIDLDEKRFTREIQCLMMSRHNNVMRFLGYCADIQGEMVDCAGKNVLADRRTRLLCFEFLPRGSLQNYIADPSAVLEWRTRYQIIRGICEGLHYLHEENIVHRDLKPANILLDHNMVPKIADFGLSQCFDENQSTYYTSEQFGSIAYLPPEFKNRGRVTFKLDIYSLGVIIYEIMTGKREFSTEEKVIESWDSELETPERDIQLKQLRACCAIAKMCVDDDTTNRPTTHHIIEMFKELGCVDKFDEAGASTPLAAQMDDKASTAYKILERILLDEREKPTKLPLSLLKTITDDFSEV
ncbi:unnamed protein product [Urochloa decumbens]|uniref:Protein kinase domain-containing protein n=1 Tax=Urochloa decumbens TaxID=240449 RepID=A0ABC9B6R7_9POAL